MPYHQYLQRILSKLAIYQMGIWSTSQTSTVQELPLLPNPMNTLPGKQHFEVTANAQNNMIVGLQPPPMVKQGPSTFCHTATLLNMLNMRPLQLPMLLSVLHTAALLNVQPLQLLMLLSVLTTANITHIQIV